MEYLTDALTLRAFDRRIPFDVTLELTRRCNQSCAMCYLPSAESEEMDTETVKAILRTLAGAQCLFLTFTGGEIFLREDTLDLIDFATDLGFAVTVKTNATLLDAARVARLKECAIMEVHVSLLGGSAAVHDAVTGVTGSFDAVCGAVGELRRRGIAVVIMSVITRGAVDDMEAIHRLAQGWGIEHVNFSAIIFPRFPGDASARRYRLTDEDLRRFYATIGSLYSIDQGEEEPCRGMPSDERLLSCTALQDGITVTPDGTVLACSSLPMPLGNIVSDRLETILFSEKADRIIEGLQLSSTPECASCADRIGCLRCPGLAFMDNGMLGTVPREACRHTNAFKAIAGGRP
ncbi:MAG: radical SAM protein [Chitinispirillaceae bacterium]|nr:radical SAM protein [Chitinispirillaceae bacterium]